MYNRRYFGIKNYFIYLLNIRGKPHQIENDKWLHIRKRRHPFYQTVTVGQYTKQAAEQIELSVRCTGETKRTDSCS